MKYWITRSRLYKFIMLIPNTIQLVRYILHRFFMDKYLEEEWAQIEGKTLEEFKDATFRSGKEAYVNFRQKFTMEDFNRFKLQYVFRHLSLTK